MEEKYTLSPQVQQSLGLSGGEIYATGLKNLQSVMSSGSVLDFGAGRGEFLKRIAGLSYAPLCGIDVMPRPADLPNDVQWSQFDLNARDPEQFVVVYDAVVSLEVIEHLENPRQMIRDVKRHLKKQGHLILSTPNNGSIRALLALVLKGHFVSFLARDYPAHITALTQLDLKRILEESGFTDIRFDYTPKGLVPGLGGVTWQGLSFGLLKGKLFSDNIFVVAKNSSS